MLVENSVHFSMALLYFYSMTNKLYMERLALKTPINFNIANNFPLNKKCDSSLESLLLFSLI